mmetsp:Transcript_6103/g.10536  ORF Transcript_6103/g.10536 Transcript_6103/m.10536 type:complete len:202 (-) Transcript_6103:98-703(-)
MQGAVARPEAHNGLAGETTTSEPVRTEGGTNGTTEDGRVAGENVAATPRVSHPTPKMLRPGRRSKESSSINNRSRMRESRRWSSRRSQQRTNSRFPRLVLHILLKLVLLQMKLVLAAQVDSLEDGGARVANGPMVSSLSMQLRQPRRSGNTVAGGVSRTRSAAIATGTKLTRTGFGKAQGTQARLQAERMAALRNADSVCH